MLWRWLYPRRRYRLTSEGMSFVAIMGLVGLAAWHSGTNLLYLMFAMLIAFFLLQGALVWLCLWRVSVQRIPPKHLSAREEVVIPLVVKNAKILFNSYALRLVDSLSRKEVLGTCFVMRVPRRSELRVSYRAVFPRRGRYALRHLEVVTRYPFGLSRKSRINTAAQQVLVYPEHVDITDLLPQLKLDLGEHESRQKGVGVDLYGLREYQSGEAVRHVHWRSSAKARKLMVAEYEKEETRKATILLNNCVSPDEAAGTQLQEEFEKAVVMAASLARALTRQHYEIRLLTATGASGYGSGMRHLHHILAALALLELIPGTRARQIPLVNPSTLFHVIFHSCPTARPLPRGHVIDVRNWTAVGARFTPKGVPDA